MIQPELLPDITHAIGNSPLVALDRLTDHLGLSGRILAKCDYLSPGFSKKDRAALAVIQSARASGELAEAQTVVELTSGNMGTGLAIVCGVFGHPFIAVMSEGNSPERAQMMRALGAEVSSFPKPQGGAKAKSRVKTSPSSKPQRNSSPASAPPSAPTSSPTPATPPRMSKGQPPKSGHSRKAPSQPSATLSALAEPSAEPPASLRATASKATRSTPTRPPIPFRVAATPCPTSRTSKAHLLQVISPSQAQTPSAMPASSPAMKVYLAATPQAQTSQAQSSFCKATKKAAQLHRHL
jgi:hypothetical protein